MGLGACFLGVAAACAGIAFRVSGRGGPAAEFKPGGVWLLGGDPLVWYCVREVRVYDGELCVEPHDGLGPRERPLFSVAGDPTESAGRVTIPLAWVAAAPEDVASRVAAFMSTLPPAGTVTPHLGARQAWWVAHQRKPLVI